MTPTVLRPGRDEDAAGFIALISGCWAEYPGCVFDLDGEVPELRALATHFAAKGGALWTADRDGEVVGMVAVSPLDARTWTLTRMYVRADQRGSGIAATLLTTAEEHARAAGADGMRLWSDTRFDRAHRFYEKNGYVRSGPLIALDDLSRSIDMEFEKPLGARAVRPLNVAGAGSAEATFADLLVACVADGASLGFLPPLEPAEARRYWRDVSRDVATGRRLLFAGWCDGTLAGTVQVECAAPADQRHVGEIIKLMVSPAYRRRGLARALLAAAEHAAADAGRTVLTLGCRAGDPAEAVYRSAGWREVGRIPRFTVLTDGSFADAVRFWKDLASSR